jgi:ATP synthase protein I
VYPELVKTFTKSADGPEYALLPVQTQGGRFAQARKRPIYSTGSMAGQPNRNDAWSGLSSGWVITGEMLAALLVWGGVGYLIDWLVWGEDRVFTPIGMVLGAVLGIYLLWLRFGREETGPEGQRDQAMRDPDEAK